jgi:hypothetical protein
MIKGGHLVQRKCYTLLKEYYIDPTPHVLRLALISSTSGVDTKKKRKNFPSLFVTVDW